MNFRRMFYCLLINFFNHTIFNLPTVSCKKKKGKKKSEYKNRTDEITLENFAIHRLIDPSATLDSTSLC